MLRQILALTTYQGYGKFVFILLIYKISEKNQYQ